MKIAYFTDTFLPQLNGVATALANQASELGARGHSILIFTPKVDHIKRKKFKAENVQLVYLPAVSALLYPEFKLGIFGLPKVIKHLVRFKPDIIHLHSPLTVGADAIMAAKIFNKPLVGTIHVYIPESAYLRWLKYGLAVKIVDSVVERYMNFMFAQCDLVLAPSKMLIEELGKNGFKKPISYLPNGVSLTKLEPLSDKTTNALKKKYGLKEKVVLHFGRLSHEKNVDILIKSFYLLAKKHSNVSLLIIGDGPAKKKLIQLTKKLRIEKAVVFTGFMEHQTLISSGILSLGDIFATASTMENNPMVVLEAMMFGLPIVGVKQAGLIELISSNGFLVKPGDIKEMAEKMEKILFDEKLSSRMKEKSLQLIKPYSVDKAVDKLLGLYRTL
ncbi:glycosyltransferase [Candidatus Daviesbacteria bacterium]|nr:glycosyltransferase [Candidatus Daviesbacteria bacterium]